MKGFKPYPEYQSVASDWINRIPKTWGFWPTRRIFRSVNGATPASGEERYWGGDIPWATPEDLGVLEGKILQAPRRNITREGYRACGTELVPKGSLLLSIRAPVGYVGIAGKPLCTNQGCRSLVPKKQVDTRFFYYQFSILSGLLDSLSGGSTFKELSSATLASIPLTFPPLEEQQKIAQFLDYQTANIDRLIERQERLLELLAENRLTLIRDLITGKNQAGINTQETGISWIGTVPQHWDIVKLSHITTCLDGARIPVNASEREAMEGEIPYWGANGIVDYVNDYIFDETLVLVGEDGAPFNDPLRPKAFLSTGKVWVNNHIHALRANQGKIDAAYLKHSLNCVDYRPLVVGSTRQKLNQDDLNSIKVPVPPLEEQKQILEKLEERLSQIQETEKKVLRFNKLLKEHKISMISSAVTGKIDVRDWQPPETEHEDSDPAEALNG